MGLFVGGEVVLSDKGHRLEPPGFIWAKQEEPVSVRAMGRSEARPEGASSQLTPELLPAWDQLSLSLHPYCLFSLFLSPPSVSSPLLSKAVAWPTFTSPTLDPLMSAMLALSTDHVHVWKWPLCSILSLFMNIHFTNRISS